MSHAPTLALLATLITSPVLADIEVTFLESAPKDRFTFTNTGACDLGPAVLSLDLSGSAAGLIFDTSGDGAGVEVFQPYETNLGQIRVSDSEIKGATAALTFADQTFNGVFDATSRATLRAPACTS